MPVIKVNNREIYYEEHGDGDVIMLLHHGFGCTKIWKNIYPRLVSAGYRIVMYDRRGFGQSEGGHDFWEFWESDRYRSESVAELKAVKFFLGIGQCHLVGQCEGGVVGVDYALAYPGEIQTLTVASTQCYSDIPMAELNAQKFPKRFAQLEPELKAKMTEWQGENAGIAYDHYTRFGGAYGAGYFDLRPILPGVTCPVLILYPDRSAIFDVEQAIGFYRHLPRGELAVFPRCGHNTYDQRSDDYLRTVLDFLQRSKEGPESRNRLSMTCLA